MKQLPAASSPGAAAAAEMKNAKTRYCSGFVFCICPTIAKTDFFINIFVVFIYCLYLYIQIGILWQHPIYI